MKERAGESVPSSIGQGDGIAWT